MKRLTIAILLVLSVSVERSLGQAQEIQQLILNWQKLQELEKILENMYKGYKILDQGYTAIKNIAEGNYTMHQLFLDGLMAVNPSVRNYKRIPLIIEYQKLLVKEYRRAYDRFRQDPNFTIGELEYLSRVYGYLFAASLDNLDELMMIITATKLRMSDDERLRAIDRIFQQMEDKVRFLRSFNNNTQMLAIQRAHSAHDVTTLQKLYGIN